jgi:F-type H+-transporting ATPase subunit alpha
VKPPSISLRKPIELQLETGVGLVDMVIPLGKGQRELVIGDRKTGKSEFLLQTIVSQALRGSVCIYAMIGQKQLDILKLEDYFTSKGIRNSTIIVASSSSEPSGLIFLTPYTAMSVAEYFRDQGMDVLLILDDMTTHARTYREISLLARRFPGRSSYPGDIFNIHAKLIERAGNFTKGSITCFPVAESILGDLSGYVQTNLMSMTDGHIFFDIELYNQGKRPAVNPFLSVTRVGHQTQDSLHRDLSQVISNFLVMYEKMKQFMHFGAEVGESSRTTLALGARLDAFLNQGTDTVLSVELNTFMIGLIWAGVWNENETHELKKEFGRYISYYQKEKTYRMKVAELLKNCKQFSDVVTAIKRDTSLVQIP